MIRGGDTPKQETLWAIEFESGKFAFGHANENEIFVATSGIGREIWYADGNGVITSSTESVDEVTGTIIDTYNKHFGTKISQLTPDTELFKEGDKVLNWNAYKKIELPSFYAKTKVNNNTFIARVEHGIVNAIGEMISTDWYSTIVDENGVCQSPLLGRGIIEGLWVPKLQNYGVHVTAGTFIDLGYRKNDIIPNFSEYIAIQ